MEFQTVQQIETQMHELDVLGAKIFVHESGQGTRPMLFLHGSPDTHDLWLPLISHLDGDARYLAIDLPGFGQSTLPATFDLSLDGLAGFIRELVDALDIDEPVTLVTTDFGGHYGLAFVAKHPDLVRGIAISNTNFFSDYQWHFFAKLYRLPIMGELMLATATRSMLSKTLKDVSPALPDAYIDSSYDTGFGSPSVRKTILRMYRSRDSKDFLGWEDRMLSVLETKPAIVLWGDKDPFITPDFGDRYGKAEVHHFTENSHWLPLEAPQAYADALTPWLDKI